MVSATRNAPALGLIGAGGQVEQATEAFRRRYPGKPAIGEQWSQIEAVLGGHADRAALALGENRIDVEAVSNTRGGRFALLTLATEDRSEAADTPNALLAEPLDESPAVIWVKDLDGRYLQVNRRYRDQLGVGSEQLRGHTDAELPRHQAIDGPRLADGEPGAEPLELEYTVAPFEGRPAFAALRFAVRDVRGEPIAVCGVAAPAPEGALARTECARLMRIERWSRLDPAAVRTELLQEWGIAPVAPEQVAEPLTPASPVADHEGALAALASEHDQALGTLIAERDQALARSAELEQALQLQERRIESLHDASAGAARRAHELLQELAAERAARERVEQNHAEAHTRLAHLESASDAGAGWDADVQLRADAEEARARAEAAEGQAEQARARAQAAEDQAERDRALSQHAQRGSEATITALRRELEQLRSHASEVTGALTAEQAASQALRADVAAALGELEQARHSAEEATKRQSMIEPATVLEPVVPGSVRWSASAQRALSAALAAASDWRTALKDAVKVLGSEGDWDAVTAWSPEDRGELLKCTAMWTDRTAELDAFETLTWQRPQAISGSALGRALHLTSATVVADLRQADDARLSAACREGLNSALLVPIRDGVVTIAMVELLSRSSGAPDAETTIAFEAVALQLGQLAHLLRMSATPHWRIGRL